MLFTNDGLRLTTLLCMQMSAMSAANGNTAFELRDSKFLMKNKTLSYSVQVSATRKIWCQKVRQTSKVSGASYW